MQQRLIVAVLVPFLAAASARAGELRRHAHRVEGSYLVVLAEGVTAGSRSSAATSVRDVAAAIADLPGVGRTTRVFEHALQGFAVRTDEAGARQLAEDGRVAWVEEDARVQAAAERPTVSWGLDRVDQRQLPLSGGYDSDRDGRGVHVYLLDTGLRASHVEVSGRVGGGFSALGDGRGTEDCNGHGTHVAGIAGGTTLGVASGVTIHPVRVLGCDARGTISQAIAGVDWVTAHHQAPAVANVSLASDDPSSALDAAVERSVASGVTYTVAAGNTGQDACNSSPARAASAITVAATGSDDARASFSNYGACVDLFAPGVSILSAWGTSDTASALLDGTSMASPYAAGVAALYLQGHPRARPAEVTNALLGAGTPDDVGSAGAGSPNLFLYSRLPQGSTAEDGTTGGTTAGATADGPSGEPRQRPGAFALD